MARTAFNTTDYVRTLPEPPVGEGPTFNLMTIEYLWSKTREHQYDLHAARLRTPLHHWLGATREFVVRSLGNLPAERGPLDARIVGVVQRDGYHVEKLIFQSRPGWYVTGALYLPDRQSGPFPGILSPHGHFHDGRFEHFAQAQCITLARSGYAVLQIDMTGYGDRAYLPHSREAPYLWLVGMSPAGVELYDHLRALDYLEARDDVQRGRYGMVGVSGGGWRTLLAAMVDQRIGAAVSVCMFHSFEDNFACPELGCACEFLVGLARHAAYSDIVGLIAPRPLLLIGGSKDRQFPPRTVRDLAYRLRQIYRQFDAEEHVQVAEFYGGHSFNREAREAAYAFFDHHLRGLANRERREKGIVITDPADAPTLSCLADEPLPGDAIGFEQLFETAARSRPVPPVPRSVDDLTRLAETLRPVVRDNLFGGFPPRGPLRVDRHGTSSEDDLRIDRYVVYSEPEIMVPSLLCQQSDGPHSGAFIVFVHPDGKNVATYERGARLAVADGHTLLAIDYRGVGETEYLLPANKMSPWAASLYLGRPLLGQRVFDVIRILDFIEETSVGTRQNVILWGKGEAALVALFATLLDPRPSGLVLEDAPVSFVSPRGYRYSQETIVPRVLEHLDIAQAVGLVVPRPILITNPRGADTQRLDDAGAKTILGWALEADAMYEREIGQRLIVRQVADAQGEILSWLRGWR